MPGPGYAPDSCFGEDLTGAALVVAGVITAAVGVGGIISGFAAEQAPTEGDVEIVAAQQSDQTACAQWQSAYEGERDPNRRASLRAAAPAHCSSFLPPAH